MRRLLWLGLLGAVAWAFAGRRRGAVAPHAVSVGYADGSAVTLEPGSPEIDRMIQIAEEALAP